MGWGGSETQCQGGLLPLSQWWLNLRPRCPRRPAPDELELRYSQEPRLSSPCVQEFVRACSSGWLGGAMEPFDAWALSLGNRLTAFEGMTTHAISILGKFRFTIEANGCCKSRKRHGEGGATLQAHSPSHAHHHRHCHHASAPVALPYLGHVLTISGAPSRKFSGLPSKKITCFPFSHLFDI